MHRVLKKDQILTIPNLLSIVRLLLIPLIVWLFVAKKEYNWAVAVILLSGATDIVDGFIARHFNMVSDFGKILDPVADKLTQAALIICLTVKHKLMFVLIALLRSRSLLWEQWAFLQSRKRILSAVQSGMVKPIPLYCMPL